MSLFSSSSTRCESPTVSATSEKPSKFADLQSIVSKTSSKVTAGKFIDAKDEFSKFEDAWKKVEDSLKKKSPDSYNAIEETSTSIKKELKLAKPSKTKLEASLQSLDKAIAKAAK
jgi:endo-alpha-1,4-polygalactosaminidase (GH114 family)